MFRVIVADFGSSSGTIGHDDEIIDHAPLINADPLKF